MKTIIVMRHAKAEQELSIDNDFDRKLKKKGVLATKIVAKKMQALNIIPNLFFSSPVVRALRTAELLAGHFDIKQNILLKDYLYKRLYTFKEIVEDIEVMNNYVDTVVIVGHNPTISYLLPQINPSSDFVLRTSEAVVFDFNASVWAEVNLSNSSIRCVIEREHKNSI